MKSRDPHNPCDAAFDALDEKIRQALMEEGAIIPQTVEEVRHAKARLRARPVSLPPHLRHSSVVPEHSENGDPAQNIETAGAVAHLDAKAGRKASDEFVEAVLIAQFTRLVAKPQYPLGHLRQNKLVYFAHRKADEDVRERFLKKAAGPYSPWAKYQGPERIAQRNGYVKSTKVGNFVGFVVGDKIDKIDQYVSRYPVCAAVGWVVSNFLYKKKEELELFATVDFAALDLIEQGTAITMENVKRIIATNKEWTAKLKREIFSDANIERALSELRALFPTTYA